MAVRIDARQRRTRARAIVVLAVVTFALAACAPLFGSDDTLVAEELGPLVKLTWGAAEEPDDGEEVTIYRIDVDGVGAALVPASWTSCVLTGLAPNTTYELSVTAYDSAGEWSGSIGGDFSSVGRLTTDYTTPSTGGAGATRTCVSTTDTDGDRLPNAVETGTGEFVSVASTGSYPNAADSDDDGISDGDETLGTTGGVDLPGMGTSAVHKDLLFEFDWMNDASDPAECGPHSHRPTPAAIDRVATAFGDAPVGNPDGQPGINVVADYGQGGLFTGGNLVPDADGLIAGGVNGATFTSIKAAHFAPAREGYFHYSLMVHRYNTSSSSSGQAEYPGDDLIVSLYCYGTDHNVAHTVMHEVGHNLFLHHGGSEQTNYKPNYNSVMNYRFQFPGVDTDCNGDGVLATNIDGEGELDYSTGDRSALNETALNEADGACGGVGIDWNTNGFIDGAPVAVEINNNDGSLSTLTDDDDWANIVLDAIGDADGAPLAPPELVTEQPLPPSARR
jgi:hypothetical protein